MCWGPDQAPWWSRLTYHLGILRLLTLGAARSGRAGLTLRFGTGSKPGVRRVHGSVWLMSLRYYLWRAAAAWRCCTTTKLGRTPHRTHQTTHQHERVHAHLFVDLGDANFLTATPDRTRPFALNRLGMRAAPDRRDPAHLHLGAPPRPVLRHRLASVHQRATPAGAQRGRSQVVIPTQRGTIDHYHRDPVQPAQYIRVATATRTAPPKREQRDRAPRRAAYSPTVV